MCDCFLVTFPRGTSPAITIKLMSHFHSCCVNAVMLSESSEHKLKITILHVLHKQEIYFYCYCGASSGYFSMLWKITESKGLHIFWIHNIQKLTITWWFVNDLKSKSSCIQVLCDDIIYFWLPKTYHSSLHWNCIPFFVKCNQSEKSVQRKLQNVKNNKRFGHDVIHFCPYCSMANWCHPIMSKWNLVQVWINTAFYEWN